MGAKAVGVAERLGLSELKLSGAEEQEDTCGSTVKWNRDCWRF